MKHEIEGATEYGIGYGPNGSGKRAKITGFYVVRIAPNGNRRNVRAFTGKNAEANATEWAAELDRQFADGRRVY